MNKNQHSPDYEWDANDWKGHPAWGGIVYWRWCKKCGGEINLIQQGNPCADGDYHFDKFKCGKCGDITMGFPVDLRG